MLIQKLVLVTGQVDYLTADEEDNYVVAQANMKLSEVGEFLDEDIVARFRGENIVTNKERIDYMDVSPKQVVSAATACIPFLENDDSNRALMGANMQRQAVPLIESGISDCRYRYGVRISKRLRCCSNL